MTIDATTAGGPLAGVRMLDLSTNLAGPYCSQTLGDLGADIVKLEATTGDPTRRMGPPFKPTVSSHFMGVNRNKRGIAIDLSDPRGREVLLAVLEGVDVFLTALKPGSLEKLGIGYDDCLKARFPRLVYCAISGFGATGPYSSFPGYDPVGQAMGGVFGLTGEPDGPPVRGAAPVADMSAGLHAAIGILAALRERDRSGRGQAIDIGLMDATLPYVHPFHLYWMIGGAAYRPKRTGNRHPSAAPYEIYPTRDGHIVFCVVQEHQFRRLCETLGRPELAADPRFRTNADRLANVEALTEALTALTRAQDSEPLTEKLLSVGVAAGAVLEVPDILVHPQTRAREMVIDRDDYKGFGFPLKFDRTPCDLQRGAPAFAEHTREVLAEAGLAGDAIDKLVADGVVRDGGDPDAPR